MSTVEICWKIEKILTEKLILSFQPWYYINNNDFSSRFSWWLKWTYSIEKNSEEIPWKLFYTSSNSLLMTTVRNIININSIIFSYIYGTESLFMHITVGKLNNGTRKGGAVMEIVIITSLHLIRRPDKWDRRDSALLFCK